MTPNHLPTSKLTPEMIQRQLNRLRFEGYFGKWTNDPFWGGYDNFAELLTDDDTCWDMDKIATNQRVSDLWRFQQWSAAHEYYAYGMGGQIGNYMTHVDPRCLRFNLAQNGTDLQLVLPLKNADAHVGIGSNFNNDFDLAQYQVSFIWHRMALSLQVQQLQQINSLMPFLVRGLSGQWNFATHDLGSDCATGTAISNYRQNKGFFWADWRWGIKPMYTEWMTAFLHKREPKVIYVVAPCAADPGYPTQVYNSAGPSCLTTYQWIPDANGSGHYVLNANTVACDDAPVTNGAINAASLAALVTALNGDVGGTQGLGTWSSNDEGFLILSNAICQPVLPFVTT
jgi:hypothetical protein